MDTVNGGHTMAEWPVRVLDHARWQAAERFPGFLTERIEDEVEDALRAGRVTDDRYLLGLSSGNDRDPDSLYVWTPDGDRVFALRPGLDAWHVYTCMKPHLPRRIP